jgi:DNA-binding winged helix-turn-helix (wHTH) protein
MRSYKFVEFTLHPATRSLFYKGQEVEMRARDFEVLSVLLEKCPQVVSKDEIIKAVWNGLAVEDNSVERAIVNIRKVLGESASNPRFIKTVRGRGYLFIAEVEKSEQRESGQSAHSRRTAATERVLKLVRRYFPALLALIFLAFVALIWRQSGHLYRQTIFYDDFSSGEMESGKWSTAGRSVRIAGGVVRISVDQVDQGGRLESAFFTVEPNKPLTIKSKIKISYNQSVQSNVNFIGLFGFILQNDETNFYGVKYANAEGEFCYPGNIVRTEGFYLVKNDGDVRLNRHHVEGKIGPQIAPLWDRWFEQLIVYQPAEKAILYYVDGEKRGEFATGEPLFRQENKMKLIIYPQGWWLHHAIEIDEIEIAQ